MVDHEINSFILKFNQLWCNGFDAHLDMEAHAGNAWIGLRLNLGKRRFPFPSTHRKAPSPSRLRRRERRAAAREDVTENVTPTTNDDEVTEKANESLDNNDETEEVSVLEIRKNSEVAKVEAVAEEVMVSKNEVATADKIGEGPFTAEKAVDMSVNSFSEDVVVMEENTAEKATTYSSVAEKQPETERRYWLCIFHGCIDNTELEDLECSCCGIECQVVEYDSEVEYEPD